MEIRSFENVVAFRTPEGVPVGFHFQNMEVAELSEEAWSSLQQTPLDDLKIWNKETNPLVKSGQLEFGIRALTLNVTQICNLHCSYCAAGGDGTYGDPVKKISVEKTLPQLKFFLDKTPSGEKFSINFLGGEPLLYPEALEIIALYAREEARKRDIEIRFNVVTNGTLFNEKSLKALASFGPDLTVSCDGPAEQTDKFRKSKNNSSTTAAILQGFERLKSYRSQLGSIGFTGVFGAHNLKLQEAYVFYRQFNVDWYEFTYDHSQSDELSNRIYLEEIQQVAKIAFQEGGETEVRKIKLFDHYFSQLDAQQKTENFCGAGKSYLSVDSRNNLYTCPWVVGQKDEIVGTGATLFTDKLAAYQKPLVQLAHCQDCWAQNLCGGGCMFIHKNKTGSKHKPDPDFCNRTRNLIQMALSYYQRSRAETL